MTQIRFHVANNTGPVITTEWETEHVRHGTGEHTGVARVSELRSQYGTQAAIRIERRGDVREPNRQVMKRFRVKVGDEIRYSQPFSTDSERADILAAIRERFPKGEIGEEII